MTMERTGHLPVAAGAARGLQGLGPGLTGGYNEPMVLEYRRPDLSVEVILRVSRPLAGTDRGRLEYLGTPASR